MRFSTIGPKSYAKTKKTTKLGPGSGDCLPQAEPQGTGDTGLLTGSPPPKPGS